MMKYKLLIFAFIASIIVASINSQATPSYCSQGTTQVPGGIVYQYAQWYCVKGGINDTIVSEWSAWLPVAILAVSLAYAIATIIFMFGVALKNDRLRTFGIGEMYEATASAVIVIFFLFIAGVLFGLLPSVVTGQIDPYTTALNYISGTIATSYSTAATLFNVAVIDKMYTTFTINGDAGGVGPAGQFITNAVPAISSLLTAPITYLFFWPAFTIVAFMFEAVISLSVQFYLLVFFMQAAVPVFLIPGVIFRAFIPTRHLGGMMMAIAIGFYFIMPLLFSIAYYYTSSSVITQLNLVQSELNQYGTTGTGSVNAAATASSPLDATLSQMQSTFGPFWLSILFFPALIIALTYTLITQIAELLGGMAKTSGRLRSLV
jgi:hypothetical protein